MNLSYDLTGTFIEACNCTLICPCWLDDRPSEDFCAGLFAWTFDPGSQIETVPVGGHSLVSVTIHGNSRRGVGSESAVFVDRNVPAVAVPLLTQAFAGRAGGPLADLAGVTGDVVLEGAADVQVTRQGADYLVTVSYDGGQVVHVHGTPKHFDLNADPLQLTGSALHDELGIAAGDPVTAHVTDTLQLDVAALRGPALDLSTRSGMTGRFTYRSTGHDGDGRDDVDGH